MWNTQGHPNVNIPSTDPGFPYNLTTTNYSNQIFDNSNIGSNDNKVSKYSIPLDTLPSRKQIYSAAADTFLNKMSDVRQNKEFNTNHFIAFILKSYSGSG